MLTIWTPPLKLLLPDNVSVELPPFKAMATPVVDWLMFPLIDTEPSLPARLALMLSEVLVEMLPVRLSVPPLLWTMERLPVLVRVSGAAIVLEPEVFCAENGRAGCASQGQRLCRRRGDIVTGGRRAGEGKFRDAH